MENKDEVKKEKKRLNLFSKKIDKVKKDFNDNIIIKKTINFVKNKKLYIIVVIGILIALIAIFAILSYLKNLKYQPYLKYEEKMKIYGFDDMYNNKSAKTNELVTKFEAIKLALSATFNSSDISTFALPNNDYKDAMWIEYAKSAGIVKEKIDANNAEDLVNYMTVIEYFENCKIKFLTNNPVKSDINVSNINSYNTSQQSAIKDMIANNIVTVMADKFNGRENIFKGELNELVVNFVEKYNTITMPGEKVNVNPEKIPSNADKYPYTLASVDKTIYEKPFAAMYEPETMSPSQLFRYKKEWFPQIERFAEEFFNKILNVDYNTISEDSFRNSISDYLIYKPNDFAIKSYVDNVKNNKIVIQGNAKVQFPAVYSDGLSYRIRVRLTFEIKNSTTKTDLIYLDYIDGLHKTYTKTKYDILVDYYMTNALNNGTIFMKEVDLYNSIIDKDKSGITQEADQDYSKEGNDANP